MGGPGPLPSGEHPHPPMPPDHCSQCGIEPLPHSVVVPYITQTPIRPPPTCPPHWWATQDPAVDGWRPTPSGAAAGGRARPGDGQGIYRVTVFPCH